MPLTDVIKMKEGETVVAEVRRWPGVHFFPFVGALLLIAAPFFLMVPLLGLRWRWVGMTIFVISVAAGTYLVIRYLVVWYWNAFLITSHRIIDIDQQGLLNRVVSEAPYDKIQDVSYRVKGVCGTLFHYGDLVVQTAGSQVTLELDGVRRPKEVHHVISETLARSLNIDEHGRSGRVNSLLGAAANLTDAEARAFLTELQSAMDSPPPAPRATSADVAELAQDEPNEETAN